MLEVGRIPYSDTVLHRQMSNMPVDYTAYLLSASPPGMGFYTGPSPLYQGFNTSRSQLDRKRDCDNNSANEQDTGFESNSESDDLSGLRRVKSTPLDQLSDTECGSEADRLAQSFLEYCRTRDGDDSQTEGADSSSSTGSRTPRSRPGSPRTPGSPGGKGIKKRVSFADDLGFALENIRIMSEPSDTPPRIRPEVFSSLRQGAQAGATVAPPLVLNFQQPASDYLEFRRRIETDCVCLENVILKDYSILGTIKVKNITFSKQVMVRCTFDSWQTYTDYQATYVPTAVSAAKFDTFSFSISVPTNINAKNKIQFCISYKAESQQFWDSNQGANYEIVSADWKNSAQSSPPAEQFTDDSAIFSLGSSSDWSTYSSWANRDSSLPYY